MKKPFYAQGLQFSCTQCGKCCTFSEGVVYLTVAEEEQLAQFLDLPLPTFRKQYVEIEPPTGLSILKSTPSGACVFFKDNHCMVYEARPLQCRTYPFWPENLTSAYQWKQTRQECPGIGKGEWVSMEEIESQRQHQAEHDHRLLQQMRSRSK